MLTPEVGKFGAAPFSSSAFTIPMCPFCDAIISAVEPF